MCIRDSLKLLVSSIGVNTGENLSAYFNMDFDGNSRNSSGGWDKGAILYQEERKDYTKEALSVDLPVDDTNLAIEFIPVEYSYVDNEDFVFSEIEARNQISVFLFKDRNNSGETEFTRCV